MPWENEDSKNKNLESLRNQFSLENLMDARVITDATEVSRLSLDLGEGQFRQVYTGGTLYLYTKYDDDLYRMAWTAV